MLDPSFFRQDFSQIEGLERRARNGLLNEGITTPADLVAMERLPKKIPNCGRAMKAAILDWMKKNEIYFGMPIPTEPVTEPLEPPASPSTPPGEPAPISTAVAESPRTAEPYLTFNDRDNKRLLAFITLLKSTKEIPISGAYETCRQQFVGGLIAALQGFLADKRHVTDEGKQAILGAVMSALDGTSVIIPANQLGELVLLLAKSGRER